MRSSRSTLVFLLAAGTGLAADVTLPDMIPPDTKVVFGVSLRSVLDSAVVKAFQSDLQKISADVMQSKQLTGLDKLPAGALLGFDPLKDVDEVIIASTAENDKATGLILVRGRFDEKRLHGRSVSYSGVQIFGPEKSGGSGLALLDESTAIVGEMSDLRAAIDRRGKPSGLKPALARSVRSMSGRFDFWGVGDLPKSYVMPTGASDAPNPLDHFEFGATLRQGLEITGSVHARTPADATKMAENLNLIEAMVKAQPGSAGGTKFDLQSSNGTIKFSLAIPEDELKKGIEAQRGTLSAAVSSGVQNPGVQITGGTAQPDAPKPPARPLPRPGIVKDNRGDTVRVTLPGGQ